MNKKYWHLIFGAVLVFCGNVYSNPLSEWITLTSDSKDEIKKKIESEVEKRENYSTPDEEASNVRITDQERAEEDSAYKNGIAALNAEFARHKKGRDDLTSQFQNTSAEFEELQKNIGTAKTAIDNSKSQIDRFEDDIKKQKNSFTKWLKDEKHDEAVIAVLYTKGFKDVAHNLDKHADIISAPLMVAQMGAYIKSHTTVIKGIVAEDFIQATEEGTAKWNQEEPLRIEIEKGSKGTVYLRIKRYELYPFQKPETGKPAGQGDNGTMQAALIQSRQDLENLLSKNGYSSGKYDLSRVESILTEAGNAGRQAAAGLNEQVRSYEEKINKLWEKIKTAEEEKRLQANILKNKESQHEKMKAEIASLKKRKDETEKLFQDAQSRLSEKKRVHESIIVKIALATPKGSQRPADASAEIILDKLEEVKNDARTQHSSSTTTVINAQVKEETSQQAVTEAKIIGLKLISFINEGDSIKVKMAFRVRTLLNDTPSSEAKTSPKKTISVASLPTPSLPRQTGREIEGRDGAKMLLIPAGDFMMGSTEGRADEKPAHRVSLDAFYLDKYEVTNKLFQKFARETGYETTAEKEGKAYAYVQDDKWTEVSGAKEPPQINLNNCIASTSGCFLA